MKYFKTYEGFKKSYMSKIDLKDFKKIKKGSKILYMGGQVEVLKNDGYVLTLKGKDGKKFTVNKAMFDHGGQINEDEIEIKVDGDYEIEVEKDDEEDDEEEKDDKVKEGKVTESNAERIIHQKLRGKDVLFRKSGKMLKVIDKRGVLGKGKNKEFEFDLQGYGSGDLDKFLDSMLEGKLNEKAKLKDLAKDLAELDKGKGGQSWITSITVEEDYDNKKGEDIVMISVQGRAGDSTVKAYVNKLLKKLGFKPKFIQRNNKGDIHEYIWHLTQFTPDDVDKIDWKDLEYYRESVNEGIVDDLVKMGAQIDYLYDADPKTQKIWKKAGFDPNDQDNIILYSYVNSWPETKKMLDKKRVKYKELEDPNSAGESYIVFKESLNELNTDGAIMNLWKKLYGEDFVSEYPAVAKILKVNRKNIDRKELARIWDETYGEDLKKEYPDFFKALK